MQVWGAEPVIGRAPERQLLRAELDAAATGRPRVVLVAGEPGIGRTTLLAAVAGDSSSMGAAVPWGGASDAEGMPPYLRFLEALGQHVRSATTADLDEQAGEFAPLLATIQPELAFRMRDLPANYRLPPDQARRRPFESVGTMLRRDRQLGGGGAGAGRPTLR